MNWYLMVLKQYAVFSGRSRRKEYWYFVLFNLLFTILFGVIDGAVGTFDAQSGIGLFGIIYALAVLLPSLGVTIRRLHDTGRTGWWLLIVLVPLIGVLVLLFFLVLRSDEGDNAYGSSPLAAGA